MRDVVVKMTHLYKEYQVAQHPLVVLKEINLEIYQGDYISIMGPSGSGKSTLMNIIGCLDQSTSGEYQLNHQVVDQLNEDELAEIRNQEIGFVFQQFNLLPRLTALENVALPLLYRGVDRKTRLEKAQHVLEQVGLKDRINHYPRQLSGGQAQRVAIARAIVTEPKLLLADEPTGALDSQSGQQIMELFDTIHRQNTTIVLITHEPEVARYAQCHYMMRDGLLTKESEKTHEE